MAEHRRSLKFAIIGAGASGIAAAIRLLERGHGEIVLFEKADRLGGTWRDNRYPGLTCDVPSHLYRFSFAPKPDWSHEYATGSDIWSYLNQVAVDRGVDSRIRFGREITSAIWRGDCWELSSNAGDEGTFDVVICATGVLHKPTVPKFEGLENFSGQAFHSSHWPDDIALEGKRVGIIGAGSTAVQILPAIVDEVAEAKLFMRTPQWVVSVENNAIPREKQARFARDPKAMEDLFSFLAEAFNHRFAASLVNENPEGLENIREACESNLRDNVHDPELRRRLTPDYAVGCKRLVVSSKFYPALQKPNAELVDEGISRFVEKGVVTRDGVLHELDVMVFCTGFDTFNFFRPMTIEGRNGQELGARWAGSSQAHRSISAPDFPNFFFIGGPNSPIGNFSFIMTAERQLEYILGLVDVLADGRAKSIEPRREAMDLFLAELEKAMEHTVWVTGGCTSWYFDRAGKVASWPWTYARFEADMRAPNLEEYILS